jgi:hypothetical protein
MSKASVALAALLALTAIPTSLCAQDNAKTEAKKLPVMLKIKVTFSEGEGEKKTANLPYTFYLRTGAGVTKVRTGSRVPAHVRKDEIQYIDVGTNIDALATTSDGGGFDISVHLERSWVEGEADVSLEANPDGAADVRATRSKEPIIRQFKTELNLTLHDGETIETTQAADPLNGKILTISVSLNVAK